MKHLYAGRGTAVFFALLFVIMSTVTAKPVSASVITRTEDDYLGRFRVTWYCNCASCGGSSTGQTASGTYPVRGRTIAVDRSVIPLGSTVNVGGNWYIAEDTGVRGHSIDIYVDNHSQIPAAGVMYMDVSVRHTYQFTVPDPDFSQPMKHTQLNNTQKKKAVKNTAADTDSLVSVPKEGAILGELRNYLQAQNALK